MATLSDTPAMAARGFRPYGRPQHPLVRWTASLEHGVTPILVLIGAKLAGSGATPVPASHVCTVLIA